MKTIYLRINQAGSNVPTINGQFGDLSPFDFEEQIHERISTGEYRITLGNDVMDGAAQRPYLGHVQATLRQEAGAKLIQVGVFDTNVIAIKTFDAIGIPADINGDIYLEIVLDELV